jgi:hypothetical protein
MRQAATCDIEILNGTICQPEFRGPLSDDKKHDFRRRYQPMKIAAAKTTGRAPKAASHVKEATIDAISEVKETVDGVAH